MSNKEQLEQVLEEYRKIHNRTNPKQFIEDSKIMSGQYFDGTVEVRVCLGSIVIWKKTCLLEDRTLLEVEDFLIAWIIKEILYYGIASAKSMIETTNKV